MLTVKINYPILERNISNTIEKVLICLYANVFSIYLTAKIQDAVKAKGINNAKFAAMMDQHPSVISKWLSGTHNFTVDTLLDIEEKLGISLIALNEKKEPTIMQYVGVVRSNSNTKLEHLPSRGNTSFDFGLALSIKATPMQPHHKLSVPIFN